MNAIFGSGWIPKSLFLASNARATRGTGAYPPYVGVALPIGNRRLDSTLLLLVRNVENVIFRQHPGAKVRLRLRLR